MPEIFYTLLKLKKLGLLL